MLDLRIKFLASLYTVLLILLVIAMLVFGDFKFNKPLVKGKPIKAIMVDVSQLNKLNSKSNSTKPIVKPPIKKQTPPKPVVKKDPPIIPKKENPKPKPKVEPKPEPKPKVDTKKLEKERKEKIQREKERQEDLKREKELKEIREKRKAAAERSKKAEQELKDLANNTTREEPKPDNQIIGSEQGTIAADERNQLMARYQNAVISAVERNWNKPATSTKDLLCHVKVHQIPGGGVMDATIGSPCNASEVVKKSILAAIHKTDPLPYKGFESVFDRKSTFIFQPQD